MNPLMQQNLYQSQQRGYPGYPVVMPPSASQARMLENVQGIPSLQAMQAQANTRTQPQQMWAMQNNAS